MKLLYAFFLFLLGTTNVVTSQLSPVNYSFFVAGHVYGRSGIKPAGIYPPFKEKFEYIRNRTEIEFGILTGDIVPPNPDSADWDKVDKDIAELGLPVNFTVGNHDMENRKLFEERYGNTYYSFTRENDLFIVLDPNIDGWNISGKQLEFLKKIVSQKEKTVDNIFVFFHQLLWWKKNSIYSDYRPNSFAGKADSINFWTEVEPLFRKSSKPVYFFAGDLGAGSWSADFMYDNYNNIRLIGSGMGEGVGDNFVIVNVHVDKTVSFDLICLNNTILNCFGNLEDYRLTSPVIIPSERKEMVKIYPNPAKNMFKVEIFSGSSENYRLFIYDLSGKKSLLKHIKTNTQTTVFNELDNGVYLYRVEKNGRTVQNGRLVIHQ